MNIAVTGGLGTGKSTVSRVIASNLGAEYLDTDQLCKQLMAPGAQGLQQFIELFGKEFLFADGSIDRDYLRQSVFADVKMKTALEGILHPLVQEEVTRKCRISDSVSENIVVEVPLLYEVGWQDQFDINIVIYVSDSVSFNRVATRDGLSAKEIRQVMDAQFPIEEKRDSAHFVIDNSGTFVSSIQQVSWVLRKLKRL